MTNNIKYTQPRHDSNNFNCPHCNAYADHKWRELKCHKDYTLIKGWFQSLCQYCNSCCVWKHGQLIYPLEVTSPIYADIPEEAKESYSEARDIERYSPEDTAKLLEISLEKTLEFLGFKDGDLANKARRFRKEKRDISNLMPDFKILESLRDNTFDNFHKEAAEDSFITINHIVDELITKPRQALQPFFS